MKSAKKIAESILETLEKQLPYSPTHDTNEVLKRGDKDAPTWTIPYLIWMIEQIILHPEWEIDKAHRWVGYIQGVMVARGYVTVDDERERVRNL